ncbi:MAG: DUF2244 domain-containing protein [Gammaproteobacteria bacterium]|nr:DUF2244 domain-containing protein [Gammaproteobacteria bacterium]
MLNADGFTGHILIEPNRPISWQDNVRFIKIFALLSFTISCFAYYQGFFLVMPFSGIEVLFVSICLYLVYKHYTICQVIHFTNNNVIIETGDRKTLQRVKYQRYWSKFHIDKLGNQNIPRLSICSKGKSTEIGRFLSYNDKLILIKLVKDITENFKIQHR